MTIIGDLIVAADKAALPEVYVMFTPDINGIRIQCVFKDQSKTNWISEAEDLISVEKGIQFVMDPKKLETHLLSLKPH